MKIFELSIWPDAQLVSVTRRFIEELCEKVLRAPEAARIAMAAHELLENAVKYNDGGPARLRIVMAPGDRCARVTICVSNRADVAQAEILRVAFAEMDQSENAGVYYQAIMRRNAKRAGSGLGLARIRAEGEMVLRFNYDEGSVCLEAEAEFERGAVRE